MLEEITVDLSLTALVFGVSYSARAGVMMVFIGPVLVTIHLSIGRERDEELAGIVNEQRDQ